MRTTLTLLSSLAAGCVDTGHLRYNNDGGNGDALTDCQTIKQQLTINDNIILDAPASCWVLDGDLVISGPAVTSVAKLNGLARVIGNFELGNTTLAKLDTPSVVSVQGSISIHDNGSLTDVSQLVAAPLGTIPYLSIDYNAKLATLGSSLGAINYVSGAVSVTHDTALQQLDLHGLHGVDFGIRIESDGALASVDLSGLQRSGDITFANNPVLATLPMSPAPTLIGALTIDNNAALTDLGQLAHAGTINGALQITNNGNLAYCAAHEVDCCVPSGPATITGEDTSNTNCHSYCLTNNTCPH